MSERRTPSNDGFRMPAEWDKQAGCLVSWPCKEETWCGFFDKAKCAYIEVIKAIDEFEPVVVLSDPSTVKEARTALGTEVKIVEVPLDDSWIRDNGPIFVSSPEKKVAMVHFGFNGWGEHFPPYSKDSKAPAIISKMMKMRRYVAPMVLEGGAIAVDGNGTMLTTESCMLNSNRNPNLTREQIEEIFSSHLGIKKTLWLRQGIHRSAIDGHVDGVAAFVAPGKVVHASTDDKGDPNYPIMKLNKELLNSMTDARGKPIEVIAFPMPKLRDVDGNRIAPCYTNFLIANGGVIAPTFGEHNDDLALEILADLFPKRVVVGVRCEYIGVGGGEVHCITQQIPAGLPIFP